MITSLSSTLAYDDTTGTGTPVILLPGAGDLRSENRFLAAALEASGHRTVNADLPGHGESPAAATYGVRETADALVDLIDRLGSGPAVVVGTSFAPAAAVWAAAEHPDKVAAVIAISPHLLPDNSAKGKVMTAATSVLLRGPGAAPIWERLYRSWYKASAPEDLDGELRAIRAMLRDPAGRRAVRETLTAHRQGVEERLHRLDVPSLIVFGTADDHFPDPAGEAQDISARTGGAILLVDGAGHYPHVERPDVVGPAVAAFLEGLPR